MCESIKWFLEGKLTEWLSGIGAIASTYIALKVYWLDKKSKEENEPKVHVWCNRNNLFSLVNLGKESLPIRELQILEGYRTSKGQNIIPFTFNRLDKDGSGQLSDEYFYKATNCIIEANHPYTILLEREVNQLTIQAMYYDNTFEWLNIDTSILGGGYILTGKGRK